MGLGQGHPGREDQSLDPADGRRAGSWERWLSAVCGSEVHVVGGDPNWSQKEAPQEFPGSTWGVEAEHCPSRSGAAKVRETKVDGHTDSAPETDKL